MVIKYNKIIDGYLIDFDIEIYDMIKMETADLKKGLPKRLLRLLDYSIIEKLDIYAFKQNEDCLSDFNTNNLIETKTNLEVDFNKINLIDYGLSRANNKRLLMCGISFSILLKRLLSEKYIGVAFNVIFSYRISKYTDSIVRFHKIRENECWINDESFQYSFIEGIICFR